MSAVYYQVTIPTTATTLSISVVAMTGDPDLYVDQTQTNPGPGARYSENDPGGDFMLLNVTALDRTKPLYIGIHAFGLSAASFSLVVSAGAYEVLTVGQPLASRVGLGEERLFKVTFPATADHVSVVVTAQFYAGVKVYANGMAGANGADQWPLAPDYAPAQWVSLYDSPRRVVANNIDKGFCGQPDNVNVPPARQPGQVCSLWITVRGSTYSNTQVPFQITASTSEAVTHLQMGVPSYDVVPRNDMDYFDVVVAEAQDLSISLTALSGNPNLYVSTRHPRPDAQNSEWSSTDYGTDSLEITKTDTNFRSPATYYIAVGGSANAYFLLLVSYSANSTVLIPGVPLASGLGAGEDRRFQLITTVPDALKNFTSLEITVSSITPGTTPVVLVGVDKFPATFTAAAFSDWGIDGVATVIINPADFTPAMMACSVCRLNIVVKELSSKAMRFSVLGGASQTIVTLVEGVPQAGYVARRAWNYYQFDLWAAQNITFTLTSTSGDPDLFVTNDPLVRRPNATTAIWKSDSSFTDSVRLTPATDRYCSRCTYFIGIYGWSNAQYTLTAARDKTIVPLRLNEPFDITAGTPGVYTFFYVDVGALAAPNNRVTFAISATVGTPAMYIATGGFYDPTNPAGNAPRNVSNPWTVLNNPSSKTVVFPDTPGSCQNCRYWVTTGTREWDRVAATYTVQASTGALTLALGRPMFGEIEGEGYAYFQAVISDSTDVLFEVTSFSGDPDLYVSTSQPPDGTATPTEGKNFWSAVNYGNDRILVTAQDPHYCYGVNNCVYYIGVYNYRAAKLRFTVTASQRTSATVLRPGVPQSDSLAASQYRRYRVTFNTVPDRVSVTLAASKGTPVAYMTGRNPDENGDQWPSGSQRGSYEWSSSAGNPLVITAAATDGASTYCRAAPCQFYLTVQGRGSPPMAVDYTIQAFSLDQSVVLQLNQPQYDSVPAQRYRYYRFYPARPADPVTISITALQGDPDLYVSRTNRAPGSSPSNATWKGERPGDDTVTILPSHPESCKGAGALDDCRYYIGVKNFNWGSSSSFTIVASQNALRTTLFSGVPQVAQITPAKPLDYFAYRVPNSNAQSVTFTIVSPGNVDLYVRANTTSIRDVIDPADPKTYSWSSTHGAPVVVTARPSDAKYCVSCEYLVLVRAHPAPGGAAGASNATFSYTITAANSDDVVVLQPGVSYTGHVSLYSMAYYQVTFPASAGSREDVHIAVTALTGREEDPDILVSCAAVNPRPVWSNFTWMGIYSGSDEVVIERSDPLFCKDGVFAIAVTDIVESDPREVVTFTIRAFSTSGFTALLNGQPVSSALRDAASQLFFAFQVEDQGTDGLAIDVITLNLAPETGAPLTVYIQPTTGLLTPAFPIPGNASTYSAVAVSRGLPAVVSLQRGQRGFCTGCTYYMTAVPNAPNATAGSSYPISFTLSMSAGMTPVTLQAGVATSGRTRANVDAKFYFVTAGVSSDVTISVALVSGDAQMQVDLVNVDAPSSWLVPRLSDSDTLTITKDELGAQCASAAACRFEITVTGLQQPQGGSSIVDFVITAGLAQDTTYLVPGVPVVVPMAGSTERRFKVALPNTAVTSCFLTASGSVPLTIAANPNATERAGAGTNTTNFPSAARPGKWRSSTAASTYLAISGSDLGTATRMLYVTVFAPPAVGNSSVTVMVSLDDTTIQLREGVPAFAAVAKGSQAELYATFAGSSNTKGDRFLTVQAIRGTFLVNAAVDPLDPYADAKWTARVTIDKNKADLAVSEMVIAPDSADCLDAVKAGRDCNHFRLVARNIGADQSLGLVIITASTQNTVVQAQPDVTYKDVVSPAVEWIKYRVAPFYKDRAGMIDVSGDLSDNVFLFHSTSHASPPYASPSGVTALAPAGYTLLRKVSVEAVNIPANAPFYIFIGAKSPASPSVVQWRLKTDASTPASKTTPSVAPEGKKHGLSGATTAILVIGSLFGLVALVGCFVFLTRFDTIRRIMKSTGSKKGYAEVELG
jgi:hypothetical protein